MITNSNDYLDIILLDILIIGISPELLFLFPLQKIKFEN